jgi:hypothetical protein
MFTNRFEEYVKSLLLILGLSIGSALIIFLIPNLVTVVIANCNELSCLVPFAVALGLQLILIIPATFLVVYFYRNLLENNSLPVIHPIISVLIPLALNIIAAGPIFITVFIEAIWVVLTVVLFSP